MIKLLQTCIKLIRFIKFDDIIHNLNLILTILKVIDTIAYQIEILIAIYVLYVKHHYLLSLMIHLCWCLSSWSIIHFT